MLLDRATRKNADLAELDRIIDFRPGQLLVPILLQRTTGHINSSTLKQRRRSEVQNVAYFRVAATSVQ